MGKDIIERYKEVEILRNNTWKDAIIMCKDEYGEYKTVLRIQKGIMSDEEYTTVLDIIASLFREKEPIPLDEVESFTESSPIEIPCEHDYQTEAYISGHFYNVCKICGYVDTSDINSYGWNK